MTVEAEMMVALESLKESVAFGNKDVKRLSEEISVQLETISANEYDIYENLIVAQQNYNKANE